MINIKTKTVFLLTVVTVVKTSFKRMEWNGIMACAMSVQLVSEFVKWDNN